MDKMSSQFDFTTTINRNSIEINRLESELKFLQQQLASAIETKCLAIAKYEEAQQKILEIDFKGKRMSQEKILMENQLEMLKNDLNRNIQEFQLFRAEASTRVVSLESKYHEKCEELNIALLQSSQLKETNEILSEKVKELSSQILSLNEDFAMSKKSYLTELTSKSRLIELYKEKNEDSNEHHRELADAMKILRSAMTEASEEFEKLSMKKKNDEMKHKYDMEVIKSELKNANCLLDSCMNDKVRYSVSSIYNNYINAIEDLEKLSIEHEELKVKFSTLVNEVQELRPMQKFKIKNEQLMEQHEEAENKIQKLEISLENCEKKIKQNQQDRIAMNHQIYTLLSVIEDRKVSGGTKSYDFVLHNFGTYKDIEELQENNLKLMHIVKELSASVDEIEKTKRQNFSTQTTQTDSKTVTKIIKMQDQVTQTYEENSQKDKNFKLLTQLEHFKNQLEMQKKNLEMSKEMIQKLSEKNSKLAAKIVKLEENLKGEKIENQEIKLKLQNSQNSLEKVEKENQKLILNGVEEREKFEAKIASCQSSNQMMTNLEFIRASIERIESEGSAKVMQQQLQNERKNFHDQNEKIKDEIVRFSIICNRKSAQIQNLTEKSIKEAEKFEQQLRDEKKKIFDEKSAEIVRLNEKVEKLTKNAEIDTESEQEMTKLKENLTQVRKIGKRYREESLELKSQLEAAQKATEVKNEELLSAQEKEELMKNLLIKSREMLTKLTAENEKLLQEKENFTKKRLRDDDEEIFVEKKIKIEEKEVETTEENVIEKEAKIVEKFEATEEFKNEITK